jgi:hypothetical protein
MTKTQYILFLKATIPNNIHNLQEKYTKNMHK